jgi:cobalt-zinc-cadmium efflux system protein
MAGRKADLNIRAAFVHMAADAGVSLGVVAAALVIGWTGWLWLDPALGLTIAVVITVGTWGLLSESVRLALDAVPADIDRDGVERYLAALPGVVAVHDLHIWPLSTTTVALTAHLIRPDATADDRFLHAIADHLDERFGIAHATLQLERGDGDDACRLAGSDSV